MSESDAASRILRTRTADGASDIYDHEISLIDATAPREARDGTRTRSPSPGWRKIVRKPTRESIRERLAHRRYAKWQKDRFSSDANENDPAESQQASDHIDEPSVEQTETATTDFAKVSSERGRKGKERLRHSDHVDNSSVIDVLYENQRGWFFFGIPLYSHSSLLNLDPAPWITKDFKDSAVDITNSQVPDPSWMWAWNRWYVDMSYDVDEEGWQYSFSFGKTWVWHGSHPWFHSFVRRRRWLRKRVKRSYVHHHEKASSPSGAHRLTADYFTIHPTRDKSPMSQIAAAGSITRPKSYVSASAAAETEQPPEDITDIPNLFKALRLAMVDREKIECVKKFIEQGGEELAFLESNIHEIMALFVFDNSRQQLITLLQQNADKAKHDQDEHDAEDELARNGKLRRTENLTAALEAARNSREGSVYRSDRQDTLKTSENRVEPEKDEHPADNIRGISEDAEIETDKFSRLIKGAESVPSEGKDLKGKGKGIVRTNIADNG